MSIAYLPTFPVEKAYPGGGDGKFISVLERKPVFHSFVLAKPAAKKEVTKVEKAEKPEKPVKKATRGRKPKAKEE